MYYAYLDAVVPLSDTQLYFAVQENITITASKLESIERKNT